MINPSLVLEIMAKSDAECKAKLEAAVRSEREKCIASLKRLQAQVPFLENKVDEFCNENGIEPDDPIRGLITSAFRSGAQAVKSCKEKNHG